MKMTMRALHRWFGTVSAIFFMFIAVTGMGLQLDWWITGNPTPGQVPPRVEPIQQLPSDAEVLQYLQNGLNAARAQNPGLEADAITITLGSKPTVVFDKGQKINAKTAEMLPVPPKKKDWHYILQDLHAGYFIGQLGKIISFLMGFSLLLISITGLKVYLDMFKRRRDQGRKSLFWK